VCVPIDLSEMRLPHGLTEARAVPLLLGILLLLRLQG
jgi:hypothetical protein